MKDYQIIFFLSNIAGNLSAYTQEDWDFDKYISYAPPLLAFDNCTPEAQVNNGILLPQLYWPTVRTSK